MNIHKNLSIALHEFHMLSVNGEGMNQQEYDYAFNLVTQLADYFGCNVTSRELACGSQNADSDQAKNI